VLGETALVDAAVCCILNIVYFCTILIDLVRNFFLRLSRTCAIFWNIRLNYVVFLPTFHFYDFKIHLMTPKH